MLIPFRRGEEIQEPREFLSGLAKKINQEINDEN